MVGALGGVRPEPALLAPKPWPCPPPRLRTLAQAQPLHAVLFLLARVGHAVADTTCAALTARNSSPARRGRNLALLQSTQSASRIFSPLLASSLYTASLAGRGAPWAPPGTLPFLACGSFALLTAPVTLLLRAPRDGGKE